MPSIRDLPEEQRPREKLFQQGASQLTDAELLAIFLRTGVQGSSAVEIGQQLLTLYGSLSQLAQQEAPQLALQKGIGPAKAAHLLASFELGARVAKEQLHKQPLHRPELIYNFLAPILSARKVETLLVLALDVKMNLIRYDEVSLGTVSATTAHPREILRPVILHQAAGFVLVHNHPSGDPAPSRADEALTRTIMASAALMGVTFHDHLIIGKPHAHREPYYSFRTAGIIT